MSRTTTTTPTDAPTNGLVPIGSVEWRQSVKVRGRIRSMRVQPWGGVPALECVLVDDSGGVLVAFLGRRAIGGVSLGRTMTVEGVVGEHRGYLAVLNPVYELHG